MASASAWAGLEEYLSTGLRNRLKGVVASLGPRSRRARAGVRRRGRHAAAARAAAGAPRALPAARNRRRLLRRRARHPGQPDDGGAAARPRRAGRRQHGAGAGAARPRVAAGAGLSRQGSRRLDPAGRRPALGSGQPVAGRGDQADPAQRQPPDRAVPRDRAPGGPPHRMERRAGAGAAPHARAALGGARGDVGGLGERSGRRHLRVLPGRVGAAAGARQRGRRPHRGGLPRHPRRSASVPVDPRPVQRGAVPQLVRPRSVGSRRAGVARPARPGAKRRAKAPSWPGSAWRRCPISSRCARARRCGRWAAGR